MAQLPDYPLRHTAKTLAFAGLLLFSAGVESKQPGSPQRTTAQGSVMPSKPCRGNNLYRSKCMIELILDDLERNYDWIDGGGISSIKYRTSSSFTVELPQEERTDLRTYDFSYANGVMTLKTVSSSTRTP